MPALRSSATALTDIACRTMGRRHVVRAARFALRRAMLDVPNDMARNGEASLQEWVLTLSAPGQALRIVDAGANVGRWSAQMLAAVRRAGRLDDLDLHAFEPAAHTHACLSKALAGEPVTLHRSALSDHCGMSMLHVLAPGAGTNSLHKPVGAPASSGAEQVQVITLEAYAERENLDSFTLVKVDTEGNDLAVLRGARNLFADQRISVAQFEYNHRWIYSRSFLLEAFEFLESFGYRLGKLTPNGVEFYPGWDADLESFVESNYVACSPAYAARLPSVRWWKLATIRA